MVYSSKTLRIVKQGHKGFLTVPAEIVEYDRLVRTGQRERESGGGSFSDNSRAELVDNLPTLAPERKRLLELLPATDIIFKPVLAYKKKSEKEIEFYERMLQLVPELRPFVPTYYGIRHVVDKRDNERSGTVASCVYTICWLNSFLTMTTTTTTLFDMGLGFVAFHMLFSSHCSAGSDQGFQTPKHH